MTENFITVLQCCLSGVCAVATVENLLVIAVFAGTKKLRMKFYAFILNLALADLVFAIAAMLGTWIKTPVISACINATFAVSILTILAAAINRYLALSLMPPARYDSLVTGCRLVGVCIVLWCLGLGFCLLTSDAVIKAVLNGVQYVGLSLAVCIVWVITALVYFLAFRKIKQYTPPLASAAAGTSANAERDQTRVQQTRRLLVVFVLILAVSFISWVPISLLRVIRFFDRPFGQSDNFQVYIWGSRLLYTLSTAINPLVYWWRLDSFRERFHSLFCRCVSKAKPSEIEADLTTNDKTIAESGL
ncbi:adenosine receptor A2b-like [Patiria miniata]|uniref:G-protein coupled receptors family 1 profile domain-containing protein n=1 Tax=Patiria miniata TaxID=46514 RepID=A0A914AR91_PATMI|nr:adenosine receptor A2b-like [Patiria miniata]